MGLAILFSCTHICVNFALFHPHTAPFSVSRPQLARNGSNFDLFSLVGYFCYDGVKSQKRAFFELFIFVPSILYFRANKRTTTDFPHSQREKQRKEMSNTNRTERTFCEQDKPYCQRDWWLCSLVRRIFKDRAHINCKEKSECGTFFSLYLIMMFTWV